MGHQPAELAEASIRRRCHGGALGGGIRRDRAPSDPRRVEQRRHLGLDRSDRVHAVQLDAVLGQVLGEGGGADRGGAVRALQNCPAPDLCIDDAALRELFRSTESSVECRVCGGSVLVVLRAEGGGRGGSDGGGVWAEVYGIREQSSL